MKICFLFIFVFFLVSCKNQLENKLQEGKWLFKIAIENTKPERFIPFQLEVTSSHKFIISNAEEKIVVEQINYKNDSVIFSMPVFGSEFRGKISGSFISGYYWNYNKSTPAKMPFTGEFNQTQRFLQYEKPVANFTGNWQVQFISANETENAIGKFQQYGAEITGTFLTETGDYRFLEGVVNGNKMELSCFDGAHAFLFTAQKTANHSLEGVFYSGSTWQQKWMAVKTENPELSNMKELTFLKPGSGKFAFSFPNSQAQTISLSDKKYGKKVILIQIFGTWCPNCMDETRFLVELHKKYHSKGLEIIGLDFEPKNDFEYFKSRVERFRKDLNVPYAILFAGPSNKEKAASFLPHVNRIISYPTAIFIDKNGEVREIHTGFAGPGTGENYEKYTIETIKFIEELLAE